VRALVAPTVLGIAAIIALGALSAIGKVPLTIAAPLTDRLVPPSTRTRLLSSIYRVPIEVIAPALLVAEIAVLIVLCLRFQPLISSMGAFITRSADASLVALNPVHAADHRSFRQLFSLHLLVFAVAWTQVLRVRARRADREARIVVAAGLALTLMSLMLLVAPYRILLHNEAERVIVGSQACYLVGQRGADALLFCPTQRPSRSRIMRLDDANMRRDGTRENIFKEVK
jgi:hypothetical protein